jgi:hypothetical protein
MDSAEAAHPRVKNIAQREQISDLAAQVNYGIGGCYPSKATSTEAALVGGNQLASLAAD